jgi:DNA-binding IclR family transcriptional regulator
MIRGTDLYSAERNEQLSGETMLAIPADSDQHDESGLASVDIVIGLLELLAAAPAARGVSDIARAIGTSKPRVHRHLRALMERGYVRQDPVTERYEIGVRLLVLGGAVADRFDVLTAARAEIAQLRDASAQAVTVAALVDRRVTVLDLIQGRTLIEFGIRPGATLDFHASAHGLVTLAFGPADVLRDVLSGKRAAWTPHTLTDPATLGAEIRRVRALGWATACDQVLVGVNALAAPILDHRGALRGTIAIVGSSQFIPAAPDQRQVALVTGAARRISARLGAPAP